MHFLIILKFQNIFGTHFQITHNQLLRRERANKLTIGEALKKERKARKITQKDWIKGTTLSVSHYSQIERNYHKINADDLFVILENHRISISAFMNSIDIKSQQNKDAFFNKKLLKAFYANNLKRAQEIKKEVIKINDDSATKYHAILIVSSLENKVKQLSNKTKKQIISSIFQEDNWTQNQDSLSLFGRCMELFTPSQLTLFMRTIYKRYSQINQWPEEIQERISAICVNYLYNINKYQQYIKNMKSAINLIKQTSPTPKFLLYKLLGKYYEYSLYSKTEKQKQILVVLKMAGYDKVAYQIA